MAGSRIANSSLTPTTYIEGVSNNGKVLVDWEDLVTNDLEARPLLLKYLGNARVKGSSDNGATWSSTLTTSHTLIRLATDGGTNWIEIDLDKLSKIITTGDGTTFLANDGTYKTVSTLVSGDIDHSLVTNLDYASSGHTGFEPARTADQNYVSDAQLVVIGNTSNTNTGDQDAEDVAVTDADGYFTGEDVEAILKELYETIPTDNGVKTVELPTSTSVNGRITAAVEGTDYPTGWVLSAVDTVDLQIVHGLDKKIASVTIWEETIDGYRQKYGNAAFSGIIEVDSNTLKIEALATVESRIRIQLIFA